MQAAGWLGLVLGSVVGLMASTAAAYDPGASWRTLTTEHFRIHYADDLYDEAMAAARAAEWVLPQLTRRLGNQPWGRIDLVLADETDSANGFSQALPYNLVGLNAVAPDDLSVLGNYDDWMLDLLAHELTHTVHIDTVRGLPRLLNFLFGRVFVPNAISPGWLVEGLAVHMESALTSAGRLRSSFFDMMLRMHVLSGTPMDLGEVTGVPRRWPQGTTPYLYGGYFVRYLVERFGEDALRSASRDYAGRLIPFAVNAAFEQGTGARYPELYQDFLDAMDARYRAQQARIELAGRREGVLLTQHGQWTGAPKVHADGTVYFVQTPMGEHARLVALGRDGVERVVAEIETGADVALSPEGTTAVVSQAAVVDTYRVYQDLYRIDLASGARTRLTHGLRAHGVALSPDGEWAVFAQNDGMNSRVAVVSLAAPASPDRVAVLADLGPNTQVWTPRFSPDGAAVVFAAMVDGLRDLYRVEVATGRLERLTHDRALDGGPMLTRDGRWLLFHSDKDGVFDLYAMPLAGGLTRRVTRVVGGAFYPELAPDGSLVYLSYGAEGFDVARLDLELTRPEAFDALPVAEPVTSGDRLPLELGAMPEVTDGRYWAIQTAWPRAWMPVTGVDTRGSTVGAAVVGSDAAGRHHYSLQVLRGLESRFTSFWAGYSNRMFRPGFDLFASHSLTYAAMPLRQGTRVEAVEEELSQGVLSTTLPLWRSLDEHVGLVFSYELQQREPTERAYLDPLDVAPVVPDSGRFASLYTALVFSNVRVHLDSISAEEGGSLELGLRLEDPWLGSEHASASVLGRATRYLENPWVDRHVLALSVFGAYGESSYARRRLFSIGGLPKRDLVLDILGGRFGSASALRGYPLEPYAGDALVEGHAEYRLPILDLDQGLDTLPLFLRTFGAALFADAASVADAPRELGGTLHASVGAEVRLSIFLAYAYPLTLRAGYGFSVTDPGVWGGFLVMGEAF